MKVNYPIKYSVMPIIEQVDWSYGLNELEREYDIVCYIVSKCYLISDLTKYKEDGSSVKVYEVVFPYQQSEFNKWIRVIPEYNFIHQYSINSNKVDTIFNTYEEAATLALEKNDKLFENSWKHLPFSKDIMKKIQEKKNEFYDKLEKYKFLEQQIIDNTKDLRPKENQELKRVIQIKNEKIKILSCSIYEILSLFNKDKFVVYSVSSEQYNVLTELNNIDDSKYIADKARGILIHQEENDYIKLLTENEEGVYYIKDNILYYDHQTNKDRKKDLENLDEDTIIFYTTETIEDIINSYKKYPEIDLTETDKKTLKRVNKQ